MAKKKEKIVKSSVETLQEIDRLSSELHPSVHYDYTGQIENVLKGHKQHCIDIDRKIYMRQYMWDLFACTMIMHITDSLVRKRDKDDYPHDKYTHMDAEELIILARNELDNILTGKHDKRLISEEQEDISVYEYTNTQKLLNILKASYLGCIAFMKLRDYEKLFITPEDEDED